ncbi:metal-dependent phosphohydrolase [Gellertiella hungarica]|uniref:(P)ppGpp synthase/HD superfamily hydrolase n=1 Tax=Gellertiella hungarica TaxID=1572859 RepID=A0A7W6NLD3_9HYPH|nr:metal-dependent phosphohydrolase [Gellertiella hungarica]MBB4065305.1 (p)ppGpp synthase/HD superfamily hydrolase [Gellertiella hungarica]
MPLNSLNKAMDIARTAHSGQKDKLGNPFLSHCERVAQKVPSERERIVAYLHDVLEKGEGWSMDMLRKAGFDEGVLAAVDALTRREGESYISFVRRSVTVPLARRVKRHDLLDNLAQVELKGQDGAKYREALAIVAGTDDQH